MYRAPVPKTSAITMMIPHPTAPMVSDTLLMKSFMPLLSQPCCTQETCPHSEHQPDDDNNGDHQQGEDDHQHQPATPGQVWIVLHPIHALTFPYKPRRPKADPKIAAPQRISGDFLLR